MGEKVPICSGDTYLDVSEFDFSWRIHNFCHCDVLESSVIESPNFVDSSTKCTWILKMKFHRSPLGSSIELLLQLKSDPNLIIGNKSVKCQFSIFNDQNINMLFEGLHTFNNTNKNIPTLKYYKVQEFFELTKEYLQDGDLSIRCNLTSVIKIKNDSPLQERNNSPSLINDLELLLKNEDLKDVTFIVDGKELHAHKAILAARSSVFLAMFKSDMLEKTKSKVEITDSCIDVVSAMLFFVYTGKVRITDESAKGLLSIADKYNIHELKEICVQFMYNKISVDNVIDILIIADQYSCDTLKLKALDFIAGKRKLILTSPEYKELKETNAQLITDILLNVTETSTDTK